MTLVLVIETSSSPFGVVFGKNKNVLFNSVDDSFLRGTRDLSFLVERGLDAIKGRVNDIGAIAVNIGPGGLSSVRSGVSFANAFAFGLKIPVYPFTSFELIGFDAWRKFQLPVLCTAKATKGKAYAGLYDKGAVTVMRFGLLEKISKEMTSELDEFVIAGPHRKAIRELIPDSKSHDSGIQSAKAKTVIDMIFPVASRGKQFTCGVTPINEQSKVFNE